MVKLAAVRRQPLERLGPNVFLLDLPSGVVCPARAVEVVAVIDEVGPMQVIVGRVVERPGTAWGWAVVAPMWPVT